MDENKLRIVNRPRMITLPDWEGYSFVRIVDILYCQGNGNYTKVYLQNGGSMLVCKTLKKFETSLSAYDFLRIHKSHLVNWQYVTKYIKGREGGSVVLMDGTKLEVSKSSKAVLSKWFVNE